MTAFDALAAAIRERLVSGRPAPLPGLGTLVRQHVSARVEERPDGTRVLLPPGETIGLAETETSHESLATAFGRLQALPEGEAEGAYARAMDQLEAHLAATGEVRLPGVGLLRRTSGGVVLGVEANLLAEVNRAFEGLTPVGADPAAAAPPASPNPGPLDETTAGEPEAEAPTDELETKVAEAPSGATTEDTSPDEPASESDGPGTEEDPPAPEAAADEAAAEDQTPDADDADETGVDEESTAEDQSTVEDAEVLPPETEAVPVPFGDPDDASMADVLPPTPADADPSLEAPASGLADVPEAEIPAPDAEGGAEPDTEDWASETWTASPSSASPPLGVDPRDLIEDADFEVLPPEASPIPAAEPVPPEAEMAAMLAAPPVAPAPDTTPAPDPVEAEPSPPSEVAEEPVSGRGAGWVLGLLLLALLVALAFWVWSSSRDDTPAPVEEPVPQAVEAAETVPPGDVPDADPAPAQPEVTTLDPGAAPGSGAASGETTAPATATTPAASAPARTRPASGTAVSPPRLDGLDEGDRRALVGGPIDPAMGGWTLVVASLRSEDAANEESALYAEAGYRTGVFAPSERGQTRYRVAVGQFGSEDHALRLRDRLPPRAPADTWPLNLRTL